MSGFDRAILGLVAQGKINAFEAERMLAATASRRETLWIMLLALAFVGIGSLHPEGWLALADRLFHAVAPVLTHFSMRLGVLALQMWGGMR
ncbi:MAG: hypothetical protein P4K97_10140 [Terracidiphilus sp.]|nr:hypothetical protein [Terracidiphilus sp.]